ncbi:MAG: ABC transporter ATP-binding protein [Patescibacteria group bacterium]
MFKKLLMLLRPFWSTFGVLIVLVFARKAFELVQPYYWGKLVDAFYHPIASDIWRLVTIIGFMMLGDLIIDFIHTNVENQKFIFRINKTIDMNTVKKASSLSLGQITGQNSGFRQKVATQGANASAQMAQISMYDILPGIATIVFAFGFLFVSNHLLGAIVGVTVLISLSISIPANIKMARTIREYRKIDDVVGQQYSEVLRSLPLVMLSGQETETISRLATEYHKATAFGEKMWLKYHMTIGLFRDVSSRVGNLAVIATGAYLVLQGSLTAGALMATIAWARMVFNQSDQLARLSRRLIVVSVDALRYFEIIDLKPSIVSPENGIMFNPLKGAVTFRNVSFAYPEAKTEVDALHNVSFSIAPGEVAAIVGHSGAGKSTIVNLLLRGFDPVSGEIDIDGVDLKQVDLGSFRSSIGYVEQQVRLWDDTLRYNLLFGIKDQSKVTEARLKEIAELSKISSFFDRLPEGFDTKIGENGVKLSGGERQRVAIARALLKDPSLLILDEATNSLDTINDAHIQQAMRDAMKGRTGIIIAHRLSTIRHADKIIVMEKGRVAGMGTHAELIVSCPEYKNLVEKEGQVIVA